MIQDQIYQLVYLSEGLSRNDIAAQLLMPLSTIKANCKVLLRSGLLQESDKKLDPLTNKWVATLKIKKRYTNDNKFQRSVYTDIDITTPTYGRGDEFLESET